MAFLGVGGLAGRLEAVKAAGWADSRVVQSVEMMVAAKAAMRACRQADQWAVPRAGGKAASKAALSANWKDWRRAALRAVLSVVHLVSQWVGALAVRTVSL